jgi:hypothetical protein
LYQPGLILHRRGVCLREEGLEVLKEFAKERGGSRDQAVSRPYEIRINSFRRGAFADLREAIGAARIAKQEYPSAFIAVTDRATGQLVIEVDL